MRNIAITMKDKEVMIQKIAFLPPPKSLLREPRISKGAAHTATTKERIYNTLIAQSI